VQGNVEEAESLAHRALRGADSSRRALPRCLDGRDALVRGALRVAREAFARWLSLADSMPTPDEHRLEAHASLAAICIGLDKPLAAEAALREAVRLARRCGQATLPADAAPAAAVCLAETWTRLEHAHLGAMALEKVTEHESPPLAAGSVCHARGSLALALGNLEDALAFAAEAAQIRSARYGEESVLHATSIALEGRVLHGMHRLGDAEAKLARAITILQAREPRVDVVEAEALGAIAGLLWERGRHDAALTAVGLAYSVHARCAVRAHAPALAAMTSCAIVLRAAGRASELARINAEISAIRRTYEG
jgi:tetratricopeptide (TPR) repeat protein